MHSRLRISSWKFWLICIALIVGILFRSEQRYQIFRVRDIAIQPEDQVLERIVWEEIPERYIGFWPGLLMKEDYFCRKVEERLPVKSKLTLNGFGNFRFTSEPLEITGHVSWNRKQWFISAEGYAWSEDLDTGALLFDTKKETHLNWVIGDGCVDLLNEDNLSDRRQVLIATFPVKELGKWSDGLKNYKWFPYISRIQIHKQGGQFILTLGLDIYTNDIKLVLRGSDFPWHEHIDALKKIIPEFPQLGKSVQIDATYNNRIVVKDI